MSDSKADADAVSEGEYLPDNHGLKRTLNLPQSTAIVTGGIIGVSIFLVPAAVADIAGHPILALSIWLVAGVLSACAALSFAELGAAIPETGGTIVHLERAYGRVVSFFYGWMVLCGYGAAALAVVAIMASGYGLRLLPPDIAEKIDPKFMAMFFIALTASVNILGIGKSARLQFVLTIGKCLLIVILITLPFVMGSVDFSVFSRPAEPALDMSGIASAISNGLIITIFSYSGSHFVTQVAGEVKHPAKDIPRAILLGFGAVLALYLLLNLSFIIGIPFDVFRQSDAVAADLMEAAVGPIGAYVVAGGIVLSTLAVLNAQFLGYPRVAFALASEGLLPSWMAALHKTTRAPWVAVFVVALISMAYISTGSYSTILTSVGFVAHLFTTLAVAALLVLRYKEPNLKRPYKVSLYPWTPLVFIIFSVVYLISLLINKPMESLIGIAIVASGFPVYLWRRGKGEPAGLPHEVATEL